MHGPTRAAPGAVREQGWRPLALLVTCELCDPGRHPASGGAAAINECTGAVAAGKVKPTASPCGWRLPTPVCPSQSDRLRHARRYGHGQG
jgi:hypothetical protein